MIQLVNKGVENVVRVVLPIIRGHVENYLAYGEGPRGINAVK